MLAFLTPQNLTIWLIFIILNLLLLIWLRIVSRYICWVISWRFWCSTFIYCTKIWGVDLKNSHWKVFVKGKKMHMMFHVIVCCSTTIIFCGLDLDGTLLNTHNFFSGPSWYINRMLKKVSMRLDFMSIRLLYYEGPLNKQWVLRNVMENFLYSYMLSSSLWASNNNLPTYPPLGWLVKEPTLLMPNWTRI